MQIPETHKFFKNPPNQKQNPPKQTQPKITNNQIKINKQIPEHSKRTLTVKFQQSNPNQGNPNI